MAQLTRETLPESEHWNLEALFPSVEDWNAEREALQAELPKLEALRGTLEQGASALLHGLTVADEIDERLDRLFAYAMLKRDENTRDSDAIQRYEQAMGLAVAHGRAASWIAPELLGIPDDTLLGYIDAEAKLEPFRRSIQQIIRERPHIRSAEVEEVLANTGEMAQTAGNVFTFLDNADFKYGTIEDSDGQQVDVTKGRYFRFLETRDRRVRRDAYHAIHQPYLEHRNSLGALLTGAVQRDTFYARVRHYPTTLNAALDPEGIPTEVYTNLVDTIHRYLPLLHRYVSLKKRMLNIDDMHTYDLYVPLVEMPDRNYEYEEGRDIVESSLQLLGERYTTPLAQGLRSRWTDVHETPGKRSGAYSLGVYGAHPYVLLNWNGSLNDVFTIAHEYGHAMHSWFSSTTQPHPTYQYTIFVAEVASTFNEQVLTDRLLKETSDPRERAYLINDALESIRTTIFRQTQFAEFELLIHQIVENGEGLTPERLTSEYARLVGEYYGPDLIVDEQVSVEWSRIPHLYRAYYVYQYATGLIAAMALASSVLSGDTDARDRYLTFLGSGSSKDPLDLLIDAGVDLRTAEPYEAAFKTMEDYLDILEQALGELSR